MYVDYSKDALADESPPSPRVKDQLAAQMIRARAPRSPAKHVARWSGLRTVLMAKTAAVCHAQVRILVYLWNESGLIEAALLVWVAYKKQLRRPWRPPQSDAPYVLPREDDV